MSLRDRVSERAEDDAEYGHVAATVYHAVKNWIQANPGDLCFLFPPPCVVYSGDLEYMPEIWFGNAHARKLWVAVIEQCPTATCLMFQAAVEWFLA